MSRDIFATENRMQNCKKAAVELAKKADVVLFFGGLDEISESEGLDRTHMSMPAAQETLLNELTTVNKNIIVVLSADQRSRCHGIHM